jgi:GT2 family glycosyltransferase
VEGISVIVLTKDRLDLFKRCAESIDSDVVVEKIVVQHGTDKETVQYAERNGWHVVSNGKNNSFSFGNNMAANEATGSHLLLLNNDAWLAPGCLDALWAKRWHPILGTFIQYPTGQTNHHGMGFHLPDMFPLHVGRMLPKEAFCEDRFVPAVTFACVMIQSSLYQAAGGLSEEFYYSFEDVDFCCRALENGILSLVVNDAVVFHPECTTRNPTDLDPKNWEIFRQKWIKTRRLPDALGLLVD